MQPSIQKLKASDGSGNASVATVQSSRSPGASTLDVDTVANINAGGFTGSMGTPHTFTDPITSETITIISEATAVDFAGHIDSGNIEIDDIAPGYTDAGSSVGDIVIIRPTTQYADNLAEVLDVAHADDGKLNPTVIYDTNGNEEIKFTTTPSAVNELTVTNAATSNAPKISVTGDDTNISLNLATKGTGALKINGLQLGTISASSNLSGRSQGLTASGGSSTAYSTNNPSLTLTPGKYLLIAKATARAAISTQDSSFKAVVYNDTDSTEEAAQGAGSTGISATIYPTYSAEAIVTITTAKTYSGRASQTFGTGATYAFVDSSLIAIPLPA